VQPKRVAQQQARPSSEVSLVGFRVAESRFAVEVSSVRVILAPSALVTVPDAARIVLGVIEHRGQVVPIVDLRRRFGFAPIAQGRRSKWIVIAVGKSWIGLAVDEVTEVFRVDATQERTPPRVGPGDVARGFTKVYAYEGQLVMVLDLEALARAVEQDTTSALPSLSTTEKDGSG
jgi:purine-binding chemotaxis protein CheW